MVDLVDAAITGLAQDVGLVLFLLAAMGFGLRFLVGVFRG